MHAPTCTLQCPELDACSNLEHDDPWPAVGAADAPAALRDHLQCTFGKAVIRTCMRPLLVANQGLYAVHLGVSVVFDKTKHVCDKTQKKLMHAEYKHLVPCCVVIRVGVGVLLVVHMLECDLHTSPLHLVWQSDNTAFPCCEPFVILAAVFAVILAVIQGALPKGKRAVRGLLTTDVILAAVFAVILAAIQEALPKGKRACDPAANARGTSTVCADAAAYLGHNRERAASSRQDCTLFKGARSTKWNTRI
eukprot:1140573-Pelagomonas_calceolata.AAC.1